MTKVVAELKDLLEMKNQQKDRAEIGVRQAKSALEYREDIYNALAEEVSQLERAITVLEAK